MKHGYIVALMLGALATQNLSADITKGWNDATDPLTVGKRVAQRFVEVPHPNFDANPAPTREITYPETCAWLGALRFAAATGDEALTRTRRKGDSDFPKRAPSAADARPC